jgi:diguanylate cyclase (GGDEF)-like protein
MPRSTSPTHQRRLCRGAQRGRHATRLLLVDLATGRAQALGTVGDGSPLAGHRHRAMRAVARRLGLAASAWHAGRRSSGRKCRGAGARPGWQGAARVGGLPRVARARAAARPLPGLEIAQVDKQFVPRVSVVPVGSAVQFPNRDKVRHHVYSFSPAKTFDLKLYIGTPANPVVFDRSGIAVLGCNIHDKMVAWVVIVETPYFGRTDAQGRLRLDNVPPGSYQLRTWHADLPVGAAALEQPLSVGAQGGAATADCPSSPARAESMAPVESARQRLSTRIVGLFLGLLLLVQGAGFIAIRASIDRNARGTLAQELEVGERIWKRLLEQKSQALAQGRRCWPRTTASARRWPPATRTRCSRRWRTRERASVPASAPGSMRRCRCALHKACCRRRKARSACARWRGELARDSTGRRVALLDEPRLPVRRRADEGPADHRLDGAGLPARPGAGSTTCGAVGTARGPAGAPARGAARSGVSHTRRPPRGGARSLAAATMLHRRRRLVQCVPPLASGGMEGARRCCRARWTKPWRRTASCSGCWRITALGVACSASAACDGAPRDHAAARAGARQRSAWARATTRGRWQRPAAATRSASWPAPSTRCASASPATQAEIRQLAYCDRSPACPTGPSSATHAAAHASAAPGATAVAVLMLDLDRFKHVNDVLGYALGDRLLAGGGRRLTQEVVRDGDVVARLGGDEFAVLLPGATLRGRGRGAAHRRRLRAAAAAGRPDRGPVSAAFGIACWPQHAADADLLLGRAEVAMYAAKRKTAGVVYDPADRLGQRADLSLLSELRRALERTSCACSCSPRSRWPDGTLSRRRGAGALAAPHARHGAAAALHPVRRADRLRAPADAVDVRGAARAVAAGSRWACSGCR